LGASVRAAAESAKRAGFAPTAADLFADADLQACCPSVRVDRYPHDFPAILEQTPAAPWMYTGGLENHSRLIERMEQCRPLYGNGGAALRRVRDPYQVTRALARRDIAVPAVQSSPDGLPLDGTWLRKGRHSSGGLHVAPWQNTVASSPGAAARSGDDSAAGVYFQQRIAGVACSAVYLASARRAVLVGVTEQLLGGSLARAGNSEEGNAHAAEFQYAGSLGPLPLDGAQRGRFAEIGRVLADEFQLVGLFGVDCVLASGVPWPVEVNPRYTASVEIFERAWNLPIVGWHVAACRDRALPVAVPDGSPQLWGKAIVYAQRDFQFDERLAKHVQRLAAATPAGCPLLADIPTTGSQIAQKWPVLTVFATGQHIEAVRASLADRRAELDALFCG
jgi:uncharacterized protein